MKFFVILFISYLLFGSRIDLSEFYTALNNIDTSDVKFIVEEPTTVDGITCETVDERRMIKCWSE